jgi:hypothetical protein
MYVVQGVKLRLVRGETRSVKIEIGVRRGCCLSPILFNLYSKYLTKEPIEKFVGFKMEEQVISTMKYADNVVLLAKE